MLTKYLNSDQINKSIQLKTIYGIKLNIVVIDGIIYRGDHHKKNKIGNIPTFFGSYDAAFLYLDDEYYLKHYQTMRPLNLLCLNNTNENIQIIKNIFMNSPLITIIDRKILNITHIFLQLFYGLIEGPFSNLNLYGETLESIFIFLQKDIFKLYNISDNDKKILKTLIDLRLNDSVIPSRIGFWTFDFITITLIKHIFSKYGIEGVWFSHRDYTDDEQKNLACIKINKLLFNSDNNEPTCAPNDLALFKSKNNVKLIKMERYMNRQYINIPLNQNNYKDKYHHYKKKYHHHKKFNNH
jgi:hypothetical protein